MGVSMKSSGGGKCVRADDSCARNMALGTGIYQGIFLFFFRIVKPVKN